LLKQYLNQAFGLQTGHSFAEAKAVLEQRNVPADVLDKLDKMYQQSELSKFAGENISEADFHLYADTIEQLFDILREKPE
jgi:hypothetical protein